MGLRARVSPSKLSILLVRPPRYVLPEISKLSNLSVALLRLLDRIWSLTSTSSASTGARRFSSSWVLLTTVNAMLRRLGMLIIPMSTLADAHAPSYFQCSELVVNRTHDKCSRSDTHLWHQMTDSFCTNANLSIARL